mmetsp:Transcript_64654/g.173154  ORF Transcript_64654/g.173154 Transcript_64654/m.173154 type:complete len:322 (-) Transcript_64654:2235-3200(-)
MVCDAGACPMASLKIFTAWSLISCTDRLILCNAGAFRRASLKALMPTALIAPRVRLMLCNNGACRRAPLRTFQHSSLTSPNFILTLCNAGACRRASLRTCMTSSRMLLRVRLMICNPGACRSASLNKITSGSPNGTSWKKRLVINDRFRMASTITSIVLSSWPSKDSMMVWVSGTSRIVLANSSNARTLVLSAKDAVRPPTTKPILCNAGACRIASLRTFMPVSLMPPRARPMLCNFGACRIASLRSITSGSPSETSRSEILVISDQCRMASTMRSIALSACPSKDSMTVWVSCTSRIVCATASNERALLSSPKVTSRLPK